MSHVTRHTLAKAFLHITRSPVHAAQSGGLPAAIIAVQDPAYQPPSGSSRADIACVAILLANAVVAEAGLLDEIMSGTPVVSVVVPDKSAIQIAETLIEECTAVRKDGVERVMQVFTTGGTPLISYRSVILDALAAGQAVFGLKTPGESHDEALSEAVDFEIALGSPDSSVIAEVIEAVTGAAPSRRPSEEAVAGFSLTSLPVAIRSNWTPDQCVERLEKLRPTVKPETGTPPAVKRLEDLSGYGAARDWGLGMLLDFQAWRGGRLAWKDCSSRLLVSGPPGVGKTMLAHAIAASANVKLIETNVSDWNAAKYLNGTLTEIKKVFAAARKAAPCVMLIDELDGLSDRGRLQGEYVEYWSQIINAVLVQLNEATEGVIIIGATNWPNRIDPAILRAGRLDKHIEIQSPNQEERVEIFRHHLAGALDDGDIERPSFMSVGGTGADIESWVRQARATARRAGRPLVVQDLEAAILAARAPLTAGETKRVAVHEAGHIIVSWVLSIGKVEGATINAKGGATVVELGYRGGATLDDLERQLALLLAGRAAEIILLGAGSIGAGAGATSDLAQATEIALAIECEYGLGELGPIYGPVELSDVPRNPILLATVRKRIGAAQEAAIKLLSSRQEQLRHLANHLERQGYLSADDIASHLNASVERIAS
jgi:hypothetical protein